jgi:histidyl-tRNA synthetase
VRFEAPRGTNDILPAEQARWEWVTTAIAELCRAHGYGRIDTPGFEDTELFARTSGQGSDVVQKEMYTFADRSGRSLTLRPEATAPICRAYLQHGLQRAPQPVKAYTIAPMWRYGRPQKGREREHCQWSPEAIGSGDPALDAELIALFAALLERLGLSRVRLELNSIGDRDCRPAYLDRLVAWLDEHDAELSEEAREKRRTSPLRVFDVKDPTVLAVLEHAPKIGDSLCDACAAHFADVRRYLDAYGVRYTLVPELVRGLDYYTRTTFEFVGEDIGISVAGGGRYDHLVEEIGGPPTPGIGFGAGVERVLLQAAAEGVERPGDAHVEVFFACEEDAPREQVLALMRRLRLAGRACDTDYAGRSLRGQLTHAGRLGAESIVIAQAEGAMLRRRGEQDVTLPYDRLAGALA